MFVYCVKPNAIAAGGCAICSARTANEALKLVNESTDKYKNEYIDLVATRLICLESNDQLPRVIIDEIYIEEDV